MTPPKNIVYFQDSNIYQPNILLNSDSLSYEPIIKKYDDLLITVTAPILDQTTVAQFNLPMTSYLTIGETGRTTAQQSPAIQTYIVDKEGNINYPVIGQVHLAGLTLSQAIECIKKSVSNYVNDPVVNIKIMSFQVTVLGEVLKPGIVFVNHEKISIMDAIGAVGDLTIYGNRKNVLLIRENNNGTIDRIRLDLTSPDLFSSPYFYLQQNDKIYIEPNKAKQMDSKFGAADNYRLSIISMVFGVVSILTSTALAIIYKSK
jgi:polysaccharide export outer membrane protein